MGIGFLTGFRTREAIAVRRRTRARGGLRGGCSRRMRLLLGLTTLVALVAPGDAFADADRDLARRAKEAVVLGRLDALPADAKWEALAYMQSATKWSRNPYATDASVLAKADQDLERF